MLERRQRICLFRELKRVVAPAQHTQDPLAGVCGLEKAGRDKLLRILLRVEAPTPGQQLSLRPPRHRFLSARGCAARIPTKWSLYIKSTAWAVALALPWTVLIFQQDNKKYKPVIPPHSVCCLQGFISAVPAFPSVGHPGMEFVPSRLISGSQGATDQHPDAVASAGTGSVKRCTVDSPGITPFRYLRWCEEIKNILPQLCASPRPSKACGCAWRSAGFLCAEALAVGVCAACSGTWPGRAPRGRAWLWGARPRQPFCGRRKSKRGCRAPDPPPESLARPSRKQVNCLRVCHQARCWQQPLSSQQERPQRRGRGQSRAGQGTVLCGAGASPVRGRWEPSGGASWAAGCCLWPLHLRQSSVSCGVWRRDYKDCSEGFINKYNTYTSLTDSSMGTVQYEFLFTVWHDKMSLLNSHWTTKVEIVNVH